MTGFSKSACLLFTVLLAACAREGPLSADEKVAAAQVSKLLPRGSSEAHAMNMLKGRGFQLSRLSTDHAHNHVVVGSASQDGHFWQVGVVIVNDRVAATTVKITDNTPDSK